MMAAILQSQGQQLNAKRSLFLLSHFQKCVLWIWISKKQRFSNKDQMAFWNLHLKYHKHSSSLKIKIPEIQFFSLRKKLEIVSFQNQHLRYCEHSNKCKTISRNQSNTKLDSLCFISWAFCKIYFCSNKCML